MGFVIRHGGLALEKKRPTALAGSQPYHWPLVTEVGSRSVRPSVFSCHVGQGERRKGLKIGTQLEF